MQSSYPYKNIPIEDWLKVTNQLIDQHPLDKNDIVEIILYAWDEIFNASIGGLKIGSDFMPNPQMLGFFIETLTAIFLAKKYPTIWKHGKTKEEKDIVCLSDTYFSIEVKSSSSPKQIFANRSYAQEQSDTSTKNKNGYYLTINFEKTVAPILPKITLIRFGYIEHSDWRAQKSEKGQQASLSPDVYKHKFIVLHEALK
jgi:ScaI restriction endonuclease